MNNKSLSNMTQQALASLPTNNVQTNVTIYLSWHINIEAVADIRIVFKAIA